ncbi:MAG: polysaccharide biosynthesis/export family protein [Parvularculaceae bacterium]
MMPGRWLILLLSLALAACATANSGGGATTADPGSSLSIDDYRIGPADKIRVIVFGEPELSGEFSVNSGGEISLPLLGEIAVNGRTIEEVRRMVKEGLSSGYINDARVAAEITTYRPFYILGEIADPGEYPYSAGMTIFKAVAAAGGFTYRAKKSSVYIKRAVGGEEVELKLTQELAVFPGDVIRVGERFF